MSDIECLRVDPPEIHNGEKWYPVRGEAQRGLCRHLNIDVEWFKTRKEAELFCQKGHKP